MTPCILVLLYTQAIAADPPPAKSQWGDFSGRFIFEGELPKPVELRVDKDREVFKKPLYDESLLVDPKSRGIANILVRLLPQKEEVLAVHPNYEKTSKDPVKLRIAGGRYEPHVVLARAGQELVITSADPVGHNPKVHYFNNQSYSDLIPASNVVKKLLQKEEPAPCPISCSVHPWESAWVVVQGHPYMALTSKEGEFTIKNIPAGKHTFQVWHESCGFVTEACRGSEKQAWKKGSLEIEIKPGCNDLGEIVIPQSALKRK